jgi:hypothetical protein
MTIERKLTLSLEDGKPLRGERARAKPARSLPVGGGLLPCVASMRRVEAKGAIDRGT